MRYRIRTRAGQLRWIWERGSLEADARPPRVKAMLLDMGIDLPEDMSHMLGEDRGALRPDISTTAEGGPGFQQIIHHLSTHHALSLGDPVSLARELLEGAVPALGAARGSLWLECDDPLQLEQIDMYEPALRRHGSGACCGYLAGARWRACAAFPYPSARTNDGDASPWKPFSTG